ncbi:MAG TPA: tetratricopeptide repeat protein, partial [Ktedonobacterales bacterium]
MNRMMNRGGAGAQGIIPGGPLGKARYAMALGRADEAERIARKRLERQPDDAAARVLLAQALLQQRQVDEAVAEARRATRDAPTNADAQMTLAAALLQKGRFRVPAEAETAAKRAVQLQPKLARARVQLAEVLTANNDNNGAILAADEAIKLEP